MQPAQVIYLPLDEDRLTNRQRLVETFLSAQSEKGYHYVYWHDNWWLWKGSSYSKLPESLVQLDLYRHIAKEFRERRYNDEEEPSITKTLLGDVMLGVRLTVTMDDTVEAPFDTRTREREHGWHISLKNGVLDVMRLFAGDDALRPHSPDWFSPAVLPVEFNEDAVCPTWDRFIREVFEGDEERVALWEEWMGYCCVWDYAYQHAVIMVGEGRNGKGVCQKVLIELLGRKNVSSVPLGQFNERFGLQSMLGKLANIAGEIQGAGHIAEERLKQISGHDSISVNVKYGSNVEGQIPARLMFATNDVPEFKDRSKGLWRRLIIVPFNWEVPPEKADSELSNKLVQELPGIFNRALAGLYRLVQNKKFTVSKLAQDATTIYQEESNPARRFVASQTFAVKDVATPSAQVYEAYRHWCQGEGIGPSQILTKQQFIKEVLRYWKGSVEYKKAYAGPNVPFRWSLSGLQLGS